MVADFFDLCDLKDDAGEGEVDRVCGHVEGALQALLRGSYTALG